MLRQKDNGTRIEVGSLRKLKEIKNNKEYKEMYEWVSSIAWAVVLALIINTFLISLVQVDGSSMVPTLHHGERLIVRKIAYTPKKSDVIFLN